MSKFHKLTMGDFEKVLSELFTKEEHLSPFIIYCGPKMAQIYDITNREYFGLISPERAILERCAAYDNAYIHPEWDYLKYPQVYFDNPYSDSHTNEIFEEGEEDIYGDCTLIYIGRK